MPDVEVYSESLEDNVMVQYQGRQAMAVVKGVEDNFDQLTPIDSILLEEVIYCFMMRLLIMLFPVFNCFLH